MKKTAKRFYAAVAAGAMLCSSLPVSILPVPVWADATMGQNEAGVAAQQDETNVVTQQNETAVQEDVSYTDDLQLISYGDLDTLRQWDDSLGYFDDDMKAEMKAYIEENITNGVTDDYEKAHLIFDWIYDNVEYAYDYSVTPWIDPWDVFTYKTAVCGGYSNLYKAMLNSVDIPSVLVSGNTPYGAHVWNAVYADEKWFYSDSTWGGNYFDSGAKDFLADHYPMIVQALTLETEDGILLGYDNGVAVIGVANGDTTVTIPDMYRDMYINSIAIGLFDSQYGVKIINVGAYISEINTQTTSYTLEAINVSQDNYYYASKDGVLFSKDMTSLLLYPSKKTNTTFILPKETVSFDVKDAFSNEYLQQVEVEEGNSSYASYDGALYNLEKSELLMVPAGKTELHVLGDASISDMAFANVDTSKITIYGEEGSPAQTYAEMYNITFKIESEEEKPVDPEEPDKPVEPENPEEPDKPVEPENPEEPDKPVDPENPEEPVNPFEDVTEKDYFYLPVLWAVDSNITSGYTETTFSPYVTCTRAEVVTFLWRANGHPEPESTENPFMDVTSDKYYYKAILWAAENGITKGINETTFAPMETVTRGQFASFLWRAENRPAHTVENPFSDLAEDSYYYDAILWAYENKVTAGYYQDLFAPDLGCTRGQVVSFLYRNK